MKNEEIMKMLESLKNGNSSMTDVMIKETIYNSEEIGDITYSQARAFFKQLKTIDVNNLTQLDSYKSGIADLLDNYYEDYLETNYIDYDLDKKMERDMILEIVEKVDLNKPFTEKEALKYISFLKELLKEHSGYRVADSLR